MAKRGEQGKVQHYPKQVQMPADLRPLKNYGNMLYKSIVSYYASQARRQSRKSATSKEK